MIIIIITAKHFIFSPYVLIDYFELLSLQLILFFSKEKSSRKKWNYTKQQLFQQMLIASIFRYQFHIKCRQIESIDTWLTYMVCVQRLMFTFTETVGIYFIFNISVSIATTAVATYSIETESCKTKQKQKRNVENQCLDTDKLIQISNVLNISFGNSFFFSFFTCEQIKYKSRYGFSHCLVNRSNCVDAIKLINLLCLLQFSLRFFGVGFLIYISCPQSTADFCGLFINKNFFQ